VVAVLRPAHQQWALDTEEAGIQREVVVALAEATASAARHDGGGVSVGALAEAAVASGTALSALALLFVGRARFPTEFRRDAVARIALPLNRIVLREPGLGHQLWLIPGTRLDARALVFDAVARDRRAALLALAGADLDDLLPGACTYLDGGLALARFLEAGTAPLDERGGVVRAPLTSDRVARYAAAGSNARRVIHWIGRHQDTSLGVQLALGRIARPWIGSFRSAGLDGVVARHLDLDEHRARAFLRYAQARDSVAAELWDAAWDWAGAEVDQLARGADAGFDAVGSVLGMVTVTGLDAEALAAERADRRAVRLNSLWRRVSGLVTGRLPWAAREVASRLAARVQLPADRELAHWRDVRDLAVAHEYLALDYLVASSLWARRAENGYFAGRPPPAAVLVAPDRPELGLRPPLTLAPGAVTAWVAWRSRLAAGRPAPLQTAGDQFLAETRDSA
jgi:hypothetical protein